MNDTAETPQAALTVYGAERATIGFPCDAAAPLVINGTGYVGCQLAKGHDGNHEVKITWR